MAKRLPRNADRLLTREGDIFLISCPGYWGKGKTVAEAKRALPYEFDADRWILYAVHPDTYLDGEGMIRYPSRDHAPVELAKNLS